MLKSGACAGQCVYMESSQIFEKNLFDCVLDNFYHPRTMWREDNVVSCVCLSIHRAGPHVTAIYDAIGQSQVKKDPLASAPTPAPAPVHPWTCSNLLNLDPTT